MVERQGRDGALNSRPDGRMEGVGRVHGVADLWGPTRMSALIRRRGMLASNTYKTRSLNTVPRDRLAH